MNRFKNISRKVSFAFLCMVFFMAFFADFLANEKPILTISKEGDVSLFQSPNKDAEYSFVLSAPIGAGGGLDLTHTMVKPFQRSNHLLGTDHLGRDILAGVIHGSRTSLGISLIAIAIAAIIGILLGGTAGFLGDSGGSITVSKLILVIMILFCTYYFLLVVNADLILLIVSITLLGGLYRLIYPCLSERVYRVPLDLMILKFIEIFSSIPIYFLILALVAFIEPNWLLFAFLIGATSWVNIARLVRAEMIKIRSSGYIESAMALGLGNKRILLRHAIPNSLGPLPYAMTFGVASIVVVESTLSYFGVGLPADSLSWGNFLSGFKNNNTAWWVAFFPGLMIFFTILSLHITGRWLDERFNPRSQVISTS